MSHSKPLKNKGKNNPKKLDNEVSNNMNIVEENENLKRQNVVREACLDLSESQKEKMISLSQGVDYKDTEDFAEKVSELKEAYFPSEEVIAEETVVEEGTGEYSTESETVLEVPGDNYE